MQDFGGVEQAAVGEEPLETLLAEHARGREMGALALTLAEQKDATPEWVSAASARVAQYFRDELPVHEAHEEDVVAPELIAFDRSVAPSISLHMMQHAILEGACGELVALWTRIAERPAYLEELRPRLLSATKRLLSMIEIHLELEETVILPRLAELPLARRHALALALRRPRD